MTAPSFDVVVPTVGRPSLRRVLAAVLFGRGPQPARVVVVDDRPCGAGPLDVPQCTATAVIVVRSYGAGPAAARNAGWSAGDAEWVAFLDDDVEPPHAWRAQLAADLAAVRDDARIVGSQGRVHVPLPTDRRPTDRERDVAGLARARWITADLAYRRSALEAVGGFDERFRRAYREDSDLALQLLARGGRIVMGERAVVHPVGPAPWYVSVARQRGNRDDALMRRRYGRAWRHRAHAFPTRFPAHLATTAIGAATVVALASGRRRTAAVLGATWLASTFQFATARARPGPRLAAELAALAVTSALIPPVAVWQRLCGELRILGDRRLGQSPADRCGPAAPARAVLFDRDGTLVRDVPYNGDPDRVVLVDGARDAIAEVRAAGLPIAVVTNQSGVARGVLTLEQVDAVNRRIDAEVGRIDRWLVCPHGPDDGCRCRKPGSGLVRSAAARFRVPTASCVVIGDTEADVAAARAVGARGILVANAATRPEEVACAPESAPTLRAAVERVLAR